VRTVSTTQRRGRPAPRGAVLAPRWF